MQQTACPYRQFPTIPITGYLGSSAAVPGEAYRAALKQAAGMPFRMVPYFDPGVWGGDWMKIHFNLPENGCNYAWSFDGVPEENSLLLDFDGTLVQTPSRRPPGNTISVHRMEKPSGS